MVRGGTVTKFRNISFRQKVIERIPESFDESRAVIDVSPSAIPPFALTKARADALYHLKLIAKLAVYIYKVKWIVEGL